MRVILQKTLKIFLAFGGLVGAVLGSIQLYEYISKDKPIDYSKPYIPFVYVEVNEFREFLSKNAGRKVEFNTQISFDAVLPESHLVHDVCSYDDFFDAVNNEPNKISSIGIGIMDFRKPFFSIKEEDYLDDRVKSYEYISCLDTIRISMKDPGRLRFSYGGTGTISLPFTGLFTIEARAFSGPRVEYTLREL